MEPESHHAASETPPRHDEQGGALRDGPAAPFSRRDMDWVLFGKSGLRCGWSVLIFVSVYYLLLPVLGTLFVAFDPALADNAHSPSNMLIGELVPLLAVVAAGLCVARIERRRLSDYNLNGPRRLTHFLSGLASGFVAISLLVGALSLGGWSRLRASGLDETSLLRFAGIWALAFLCVGLLEEGSFRCFLQFTLTRGMNFWWALAAVAALCLRLSLKQHAHGAEGVYVAAALGVVPCWLVHRAHRSGSNFWQTAWAVSTAFGYYHTHNGGETAIGIFAAAFIGFVFCVSVRLTGSAWWAIGCHASWDWAETYFYGTADSGYVAPGHYLTTTTSGNPLWSGGTDGPEGSLLVIGVSLLLLVALIALYGRKKPPPLPMAATEPLAG